MSDDQEQSTLRQRSDQAAEDHQRIAPILDRALADMTSCLAAMDLVEPDEVVEEWVDRVWNNLRRSLSPEDRLRAIVFLLTEAARQNAATLLRPHLEQP